MLGFGTKVNEHAWVRVPDPRTLPALAVLCGIMCMAGMVAWPDSWAPVIVLGVCLTLIGARARRLCEEAHAGRRRVLAEFCERDDVREADAVAVRGSELSDFLVAHGVDRDAIVRDSDGEAVCIVRNSVATVPAMLAPSAVPCHALVMRFLTDDGVTCEFLHVEDVRDHDVDALAGMSVHVWYATDDDGVVTQVEYET